MKKLIYLFVIIAVSVAMVSCADKHDNDLNQTGLYDQSGNLITNTLIETNKIRINGDIPVWATNIAIDYIVITNSNYTEIKYPTNVTVPNLPKDPTAVYRIRVPYAGKGNGFYNVDYRDTNKLNQLWLDQIQRKGVNDGKVFAIRNKANNRDANNFQKIHGYGNYNAKDYYYFKENGDIVWKGDDVFTKKFMGAIIVRYKGISEKVKGDPMNGNVYAGYHWTNSNVFTVGAIYAATIDIEDARWEYMKRRRGESTFKDGDDPFRDGVFNFHSPRYKVEVRAYPSILNMMFERIFYRGFIEVLVMNPQDNMGYKDAMGLHTYYAYYGIYDGNAPTSGPYGSSPGFQDWNMPYMTNHNIYIGERPEYTMPLLTATDAFTDADRGWNYLLLPGHKN